MSSPSAKRCRNPWLLTALALIVGWGMPVAGEDLKHELSDKILDLRSREKSRIEFLQELGNVSNAPGCSLSLIFWHDIDVPYGAHLTLGIFRIDRLLRGTSAYAKAD